ncbi:hypothetical protein ILUMI_00642, partial [Ignelater luminosus]
VNPLGTLKRFSIDHKRKIDVLAPCVILEYNRHMGGVDTPSKSKRWYFEIFGYLLDLFYGIEIISKECSSSLSRVGKRKRGSSLSLPSSVPEHQRIGKPLAPRPTVATRFDDIHHYPVCTTKVISGSV